MFHHCNDPIRFSHFEHLELPRCCIVTWHLLAAKSKSVENFEPSSEYSLWCWQQRKIVSEYSQLACEWFLPWQEIRLKIITKQFDSTVFLFMTSDNTCIIGCFQLKNENPMCEHLAHQVNVSRMGVLCTPDSSKFWGAPCIVYYFKAHDLEIPSI